MNSYTPSEKIIHLVDDNPSNLNILFEYLTSKGFNVSISKSGEQALERISRIVPDLILLDVMMPPGIDGFEVCRRLKSSEETRDIPVVFMTALTETSEKIKGFQVGAVDYVTKPIQHEEVYARINAHLTIRTLQQQLQAEAARFRTLTDATFEGIVLHEQGAIIDVNLAAARLLKRRRSDLIGTALSDYFPAEFQHVVLDGEQSPEEIELLVRQGERIPIAIHTKPLEFSERDIQVTAIRDLSQQKALEQHNQQLQQENSALKIQMRDSYSFGNLIGWSASMQRVYALITQAAESDYNVVITGESGTGKELVAQAIHQQSSRAHKSFVPVNCGAVTESLFEREFFGHRKGAFTGADRDTPGYFDMAHQGTLFLDEFGELSPAMQIKLLRVLESKQFMPVGASTPKQVDVRILAATNQDLYQLVEQGIFRQDLFYRIHVFEIHISPLRDRIEDIPLLLDHFLTQHAKDGKPAQFPRKVMEMLLMYEWPGNVRELQNALQRYLATGQLHLAGMRETQPDIVRSLPESAGLQETLEALEYRMIVDALQQAQGHRGKVCEMLNIPRRTLQRKMLKYGLRSAD